METLLSDKKVVRLCFLEGLQNTMLKIIRKLGNNARLLQRDPEAFARNLLQFTNPKLFEQRMINMLGTVPMHVRFNDAAPSAPRLNVLDTAWTKTGMTGGPNTIINLACRVAQHGVQVRLVSTQQIATIDPEWFAGHAASLLRSTNRPNVQTVSAANALAPLDVGPGDMFLATHWSTAQQLKAVLPLLPVRRFFYMLQEFEPGFYPWSSNFALALETLGMDFWPIINQGVLADFLLAQPYGRLAEPATRARALVFEPAVDAGLFRPPDGVTRARPRRLLFYARPSNTRNMFGLGLLALRQAALDPAFAGWEFLSIGSRGSVPPLALGGGHMLRPAAWQSYKGYADQLRDADVLLCPMLSPHTSYPVLEMAACGGFSVTNVFATKTASFCAALSPNILAVDPTMDALADALVVAAGRINTGEPRTSLLDVPRDWAASLDPVAQRVAEILRLATQV